MDRLHDFPNFSYSAKSSMSIPRLPTELCERIIDVVASDSQFEESPSVLSSCALVSWRWVPRTRIHLYRQVILDSQTRAHKFLISLSLTPGLGQFVKTLVIDISRESRDPSHNWLYKAMGTLPGFLTHIQELKLWGLPLVQSVFMTLISQFITVETLELYQLEYQSFAEIVRMINRFPKVQEVKLLGNSWKSPARYYSGRRLNFTGLEIRAPPRHSEDILKWAVKSRSAECLRTFRFHCTSPSSRFQERLEDVLWSCTRTLEKIALEVEPALRKLYPLIAPILSKFFSRSYIAK